MEIDVKNATLSMKREGSPEKVGIPVSLRIDWQSTWCLSSHPRSSLSYRTSTETPEGPKSRVEWCLGYVGKCAPTSAISDNIHLSTMVDADDLCAGEKVSIFGCA